MTQPDAPTRCPRCGAPSAAGRFSACPMCLLEEELPSVLGESYELQDKIGEGGMGTVYRARHRRLDRLVALKFLAEPLAAQADLHQRLEAEGRAMARLDHPHIVAIHDLGRSLGHSYIVMEYVDGPSLARLLPLPLKRALEVADQVCDALAYAHSRGVVHCDIKPQNILIDAAGRAKVSDFGIARILMPEALDDDALVAPARVMGTEVYMAPEARAGAPADPRMDVYSLGVLLHAMLTGRPPASGPEPSGPVRAVLRRALCADPAGRYADAAEMRRELARVARGAAHFAAEPPEALRIRLAAGLLALIAAVGLQAVRGALPVHLPAEPPWGPLLVGVAAALAALPILRALHRRWRQETPGHAPSDYVPLGTDGVVRAGMAALLALAAAGIADRTATGGVVALAHGLADLLAVWALYRSWIVFLDARRVRRPLGEDAMLLALGIAPSLVQFVPIVAAWLRSLAS